MTRETRMGDAIELIMKFTVAESATMLLMSNRGRTGLERILEGNVASSAQAILRPGLKHASTRAESLDSHSQDLFQCHPDGAGFHLDQPGMQPQVLCHENCKEPGVTGYYASCRCLLKP